MGAKYHTIHHTHYHYNFGQFFIFADYIFGSLYDPNTPKKIEWGNIFISSLYDSSFAIIDDTWFTYPIIEYIKATCLFRLQFDNLDKVMLIY